MKRTDKVYLEDMLESIDAIDEYVADVDEDTLKVDGKTLDSVIRRLEIIGEAASHLPDDFREKYAMVPWGDIIGMRNVLIHEYFGVLSERVWDTVKNELPELRDEVRKMMEEYE